MISEEKLTESFVKAFKEVVEPGLSELTDKVDDIDKRLEKVEDKLDKIDDRLDRQGKTQDKLVRRVEVLESKASIVV